MTTFEKISLEAGRNKLKELLDLLPMDNVNFFNKLFGDIESIKLDKMDSAISICERTIEKSKRTRIVTESI